MTLVDPLEAAICAQVLPSLLAMDTSSGLLLRNNLTTFEWLLSAARWSGV